MALVGLKYGELLRLEHALVAVALAVQQGRGQRLGHWVKRSGIEQLERGHDRHGPILASLAPARLAGLIDGIRVRNAAGLALLRASPLVLELDQQGRVEDDALFKWV